MPVDRQCQAIIDAAAKGGTPFDADDHVAARGAYISSTSLFRHETPPLDHVANLVCKGPGGNIRLRMYCPLGDRSTRQPALIYFHGGGWAAGDLDTHDHLCRYLAAKSRITVIAIDYRLAPEHKFPAAYDDALATTQWIMSATNELNVDINRVAIGGDSAGGNLAAAVCLALRDTAVPRLKFQLLIYPVVDFLADTESQREYATGYVLTKAAMTQFTNWYLPDDGVRSDWRASPQQEPDKVGLPAAFIQTAEFDLLRDEGRQYADALSKAGVPVQYKCYAGMIHGFMRMGAKIDAAFGAMDDAAEALGQALV